jgi:hypothetical protein
VADIFFKEFCRVLASNGHLAWEAESTRPINQPFDGKRRTLMAISIHPQRSADIVLLPVGVFEDDALLLRLAAGSRPVDSAGPRGSGPIDLDDFAFKDMGLGSETWEL